MKTSDLIRYAYIDSRSNSVAMFKLTNSFRTMYCIGIAGYDRPYYLAYRGKSYEMANGIFDAETSELSVDLPAGAVKVEEFFL